MDRKQATAVSDEVLVRRTIAQWERIGAAYAIDATAGRAAYEHETDMCRQQERICRLRVEHDLDRGLTAEDMAICRACPIKLATRRTCFGNIRKGWPHDVEETLADAGLAKRFARGVVDFLETRVLTWVKSEK